MNEKTQIDLILVDEQDNPTGKMEKLQAHLEGKLHRAFSLFIFNDKKELMLQKRAQSKYHSGSLWTNTVCGHPYPNEDTEVAAHRRLNEEMGFDCDLQEMFSFLYRADLDHNVIERELDHVFFGRYNHDPILNPHEAEDWKWISIEELKKGVDMHPEQYTYWMKVVLDRVVENMN